MIIYRTSIDGTTFYPAKCEPPVSTRMDCAAAFLATDERVNREAG
jgi:hypothetical protein